MKRFFYVTSLIFICLCGFIQPISVLAKDIQAQPTIESRADIIKWRYKTENGKVYKRLFNHSKKEWIGNWILVG